MIVTLLRDNFGKLNAFYFDFFFIKGLIFWDIHKKKEEPAISDGWSIL